MDPFRDTSAQKYWALFWIAIGVVSLIEGVDWAFQLKRDGLWFQQTFTGT